MMKTFKQYLIEAAEIKFTIPKEIAQFTKVVGGLDNTKNWETTVLLANSAGQGVKVGDKEQPRYIMISLDSNNIIPIAISDEHKTGYDLTYELFKGLKFGKEKIKINKENYVSVCSWGTHYIYHGPDFEDDVKALQKFIDLGGDKNLIIKYTDAKNKTGIATAEKFLETKGDIDKFITKGKLNTAGRLLVKYLESTINAIIAKDESAFKNVEFIINNILNKYKFELMNFYDENFEKKIAELKKNKDIAGLEAYLLGHNGIKNNIHNAIRKYLAKDDSLFRSDAEGLELIFGDVELALEEFNRLGKLGKK